MRVCCETRIHTFLAGTRPRPSCFEYFLSIFRDNGIDIEVISFCYDTGSPPFSLDSEWTVWLKKHPVSWWIGMSLGASLAWVFASLLDDSIKPRRLTLINPFASRKQLAEEQGFSLNEQWDFAPLESKLTVSRAEIVVSIFDEKLPIQHGIRLLNKIEADIKRVIFVDDNHQIQTNDAQEELAKLLIASSKEIYCGTTYYCHIYQ
jgi:hypothetical protein